MLEINLLGELSPRDKEVLLALLTQKTQMLEERRKQQNLFSVNGTALSATDFILHGEISLYINKELIHVRLSHKLYAWDRNNKKGLTGIRYGVIADKSFSTGAQGFIHKITMVYGINPDDSLFVSPNNVATKDKPSSKNRIIKLISAKQSHKVSAREAKLGQAVEGSSTKNPILFEPDEELSAYIIMQLKLGMDLFDFIDQQLDSLSISDRLRLIRAILVAMDKMHKAGVVHRDIKSENIVLAKNDKAHVIDFGHAKEIDAVDERSNQTGTPGYQSPEQVYNKATSEKTDLLTAGFAIFSTLFGSNVGEERANKISALRQQINADRIRKNDILKTVNPAGTPERHTLINKSSKNLLVLENRIERNRLHLNSFFQVGSEAYRASRFKYTDPVLAEHFEQEYPPQYFPRFLEEIAAWQNAITEFEPAQRPSIAEAILRLDSINVWLHEIKLGDDISDLSEAEQLQQYEEYFFALFDENMLIEPSSSSSPTDFSASSSSEASRPNSPILAQGFFAHSSPIARKQPNFPPEGNQANPSL